MGGGQAIAGEGIGLWESWTRGESNRQVGGGGGTGMSGVRARLLGELDEMGDPNPHVGGEWTRECRICEAKMALTTGEQLMRVTRNLKSEQTSSVIYYFLKQYLVACIIPI